ncbi:MAG: hypothetical protein GXP25_14305 [Planctomycetes bacterium]|nr:hypothetical protein [Planctomycetota bacterium]
MMTATAFCAEPTKLYVAPNGNDTWSGTLAEPNAAKTDGPFATLDRARDEVRKQKPAGGAAVEVRGGDYLLDKTFELTADDSAPKGGCMTYCVRKGETARLMGGVEITGFRPYKDKIVQADVSALGLDKIPPVEYGRYSGDVPGFELFFQGKRLVLARWPNKIPDDPRWGEWAYIPKTTDKTREWFYYPGDRPAKWSRPQEAQIHWFPWYNYMDQYVGIQSVDAEKKIIHLAKPASYPVQPGRRFYIQNVFEELDAPGEWYLDREKGILYLWPPAPLAEGKVVASKIETIVHLKETTGVTLQGFTIESCRGDAVVIEGGSDNTLAACTIRNALQDGVWINGGTNNGAVGNDIYEVGRRGILLDGGDRKTLTPARNHATNNHIHHMSRLLHTYAPGIQVHGCGNIVRHNLIHDGPHMLIGLSGNDHLFEFNDIHHGMMISSHGGTFYCGRDFTARGNIVRYNKFHDINGYGIDHVDREKGVFVYASPVRHLPGAFAVHLDDQESGFHIYGNLFYRLAHGAIRTGGGRDNVIENNIFVDAGWAVHLDNRGMGWQKRATRKGTLMRRLLATDYKNPPWSERYPELVDILDDRLGEPVDNVVRRNIFSQEDILYNFSRVPTDRFTCDYNVVWRGGEEVMVTGRTYNPNAGGVIPFKEWQKMGFDTHSKVADPLFVDAANDDFRLRDDSPALALGFKPIPIEKIGLYDDPLRASPPPPPDARKMSSKQVIEEYPIPDFKPQVFEQVEVRVEQSKTEINVDGKITPEEWNGADRAKALVLRVDAKGNPMAFKSYAWVTHDGANLYIAVSNDTTAGSDLDTTATWGRDDGMEIAIQDVSEEKPGTVLVLRGFPTGSFSGVKGGKLVKKVQDATKYAARIVKKGRWDAEWMIPLEAMGVRPPQPAREPKLRLNITVCKPVAREWVMWQPTHGRSYLLDKAGILVLTLPQGG